MRKYLKIIPIILMLLLLDKNISYIKSLYIFSFR